VIVKHSADASLLEQRPVLFLNFIGKNDRHAIITMLNVTVSQCKEVLRSVCFRLCVRADVTGTSLSNHTSP